MAEVGDENQQEIADTRPNVTLLLGRLAGARWWLSLHWPMTIGLLGK